MAAPVDDIAWALEDIAGRAGRYARLRRYYDGDHDLTFATEKWRTTFGTLFEGFRDNLCPAVVDALTDRLRLTTVASAGARQPGDADPIADAVADVWRLNRLDRRTGEVHLEASKLGDGFVVVWPKSPEEPNVPVITPQRAERIAVSYDEGGNIGALRLAAKVWPFDASGKRWRLNLYYPDRIEKLVSRERTGSDSRYLPDKADAFEPYDDPVGGATVANPYDRVPVFHFGNNAPVGQYGRAELADVLPIQDALNKAVADMLVAMEFQALPQRWVAGLEPVIDPTTGQEAEPFEPGADRLWQFVSDKAKAGQFEAADLRQFIAVQDSLRAECARVSRTPLHYLLLSGTFPSGEALNAAESPLEAKADDRRGSHGEVWEDVIGFALTVARRRETGEPLQAVWADTKHVSPKEQAEALAIKRTLGVSQRQVLRELGYTEEDITRMALEDDLDGSTPGTGPADAAAGTAAGLRAFDGGLTTGEGSMAGIMSPEAVSALNL